MKIQRVDSRSPSKGSAEWFTGTVKIDPLFEAREYVVAGDRRIDREAAGEAVSDREITSQPADVRCASVTFEAGARTAWHTHPLGQTLIVTSGLGWAQRDGGPIEEIRPGDVVWFAPGEKHWHGATPTTAMSHIAIQEALEGQVVQWMEKVSDQQYGAK